MVIRELLIRLGLQGTEQTGRDLDKIDGKVHSVTESFRGLGTVLTGLLTGISIKSIIDVADEMQSLEFRVGQMVTSTKGGAEAIDNLAKHASDARVSIESYAEAYTGIGAATHELIHTEEDLLQVTDSVAKGLQLAGANTQQTTSVMMQLTQAIAVGKLQWEDMRIIMQNSDAFALRLAKSMGMTLNQMVKATQGSGGGIGADKIVNALRNMSGDVKKEFASMPMTVTQATTIIGNRWEMFIHRMNRSSLTVTWIADKFLWLADKIEYSFDIIIDSVGGAQRAIELLGSVLGGLALVGGIYALRAAFVALASPIGLVAIAAAALYLAFDEFRTWQRGGDSVLGDLLGDYEDYRPTIEKITAALNSFKDIVGGWETIFATFAAYLAGAWLASVLRTLGIVSSAAAGASAGVSTAGVVIAAAATGYKAYSGITDAATSADKTESLWDSIKRRWNYGGWYNNQQANMSQGIGFSPQSIGRGQLIYNPTVNLTVNSPSGTPEDIKKAVDEAMSGQLPKIQDSFSSDLLFSGRVR
ncbi:tape measure protein [Klebsiella aerogenes]|uniref:tape measure protein n=1 Tax=Klebsiella aerogenes TaxID=548 RepID=UPI0009BA3CA6|nr:tape measure protein [Klebsiella aerogenes]